MKIAGGCIVRILVESMFPVLIWFFLRLEFLRLNFISLPTLFFLGSLRLHSANDQKLETLKLFLYLMAYETKLIIRNKTYE